MKIRIALVAAIMAAYVFASGIDAAECFTDECVQCTEDCLEKAK